MDALTLLHQHIDMTRLLDHYGFKDAVEEGNHIRSCCKLHDGDNPKAFVVNLDNKLWFCHTGGCGGGDAFTLVQRMEDVGFTEAVRKVASIFNVSIDDMQIAERTGSHMKEMALWIKAIQSRRLRKYVPYEVGEETKNVTKFRDFLPATLAHFGLKYVEQVTVDKRGGGTYQLNNRLAFPITLNDTIIGCSYRRMKSTDNPKWSHQPVNMKTGDILYNYDSAKGQKTVVVVEGIPDVWAYHEIGVIAVATFGAHLSEEQKRLLLRLGADIVLSYDGDEAGKLATDKAYKTLYKTTNIKCVVFDVGQDPANITREELKKYYDNRT